VAAATIPRAGGQLGAGRPSGTPDRSQLGRAPAPVNGMIGRVIGERYGVTALIGEGGMGEVYEAKHLGIGRLVAIKVLNPSRAHDQEAISRLRHEARVAGTLGHPNICAVYDMGRLDDGSPYLVMERLHGETLAQRLLREARLPVDDLVDVVVQVLSALAAAHQRGIVHRDLKPDNIFLSQREGMRPVPKLLDFGISKSEDMEETMAELSSQTVAAGTPFYMAPEQARGDRRLDHRVDLWATGIILYECLTGQRPFDARNYNALLVQIQTAAPRALRELQPDVPVGLERLVERALSKAPEERFQSAIDLQTALRAVNLVGGPAAAIERVPTPRPVLASDPTSGEDPDATFVFSRAAMGLADGEPMSQRLFAPASQRSGEPASQRALAPGSQRSVAPGSQRWPEAIPLTPPPPPVTVAPPPVEANEPPEETTSDYAPFTDDDNERTMVDEPRFLRDSASSISRRDTIPMPPRKE
jgi:serine/threonine-protein kinase